MSKAKILVVHLTSDDLNVVLEKIRKLNTSAGPFDYAFLLGSFDPVADALNGTDLPDIIPISSMQERTPSSEGFGILSQNKKLRVGYVALPQDKLAESVGKVLDLFENLDHSLDILITNVWSVAIAEKSDVVVGNNVIDRICKKTRPAYHFTFGNANDFFELEPFAWPGSDQTTRFINLAAFHSKKKWAYAFSIDFDKNSQRSLGNKASNLIQNPYLENTRKRDVEQLSLGADRAAETKKMKAVLPSNCHFCFTNPNVEDHMFVSISNHAYLTTAKGPLSVPSGDMSFSGHCLIVPIQHIPKLNVGQDGFLDCEPRKELMSYESSVVKMNHRKFDMSTVVFEIHSDRSVHFHKQIIPVPKYLIMKFKDALERQVYLNNERYKNNAKMDFKVFSSNEDKEYLEIIGDSKRNFFQFTVYETSQSEPTIYLSQFSADDRLDLQFGRRVVAFLLRLPKRVNWTSPVCKQSKEQESEEVERFQKGYSEFDIAN